VKRLHKERRADQRASQSEGFQSWLHAVVAPVLRAFATIQHIDNFASRTD